MDSSQDSASGTTGMDWYLSLQSLWPPEHGLEARIGPALSTCNAYQPNKHSKLAIGFPIQCGRRKRLGKEDRNLQTCLQKSTNKIQAVYPERNNNTSRLKLPSQKVKTFELRSISSSRSCLIPWSTRATSWSSSSSSTSRPIWTYFFFSFDLGVYLLRQTGVDRNEICQVDSIHSWTSSFSIRRQMNCPLMLLGTNRLIILCLS